MSVRMPQAMIDRLDALLPLLQASRAYQLRGLDSRMDAMRLALEVGITALEKETSK
jgi:predicted DNA-binding protein